MRGRIVYANFRVHWRAHHNVLLPFSGRQRLLISWSGKLDARQGWNAWQEFCLFPPTVRICDIQHSHLLRGKYWRHDMLLDLSKDNTGCSATRAFSGRPRWRSQHSVCQTESRHEGDKVSQALPDRSLSRFQLAVNSCKPLADGIFDKLSAIMDIELLH